MITEIDEFFNNCKQWKDELNLLRSIVLNCNLTETFKWRSPCYTYKNKNMIIIGGFKDYCVISFLKGALLSDVYHILEKPGENSQSAKIIRFKHIDDIIKNESIIKQYIIETIDNEDKGLKIEAKSTNTKEIIPELQDIFDNNPILEKSFYALTPGRQRGYIMFFSEPKQSATKTSRIEKATARILSGKGLLDCICGMSKRMPNCDGSHKFIVKNND